MVFALSAVTIAAGIIVLFSCVLLSSVADEDDFSLQEWTRWEVANILFPLVFLLYLAVLARKRPKSAIGVALGMALVLVGVYFLHKVE